MGRDTVTKKRKYLHQALHGELRDARAHLLRRHSAPLSLARISRRLDALALPGYTGAARHTGSRVN